MNTIVKKFLIATGLCAAMASQATAGNLQINLDRMQPKLNHKIPAINAPIRIQCPNPMVRDINVRVLTRSASQARILVTAVIENAGGADYVSGPNQQTITLTRGNQRLTSRDFTTIRVGNRIEVSYPQIVSAHGYGEFPPTFHAYLAYDPDVRIDGNPANDDCRVNDNRKSLNGNVVNALLR